MPKQQGQIGKEVLRHRWIVVVASGEEDPDVYRRAIDLGAQDVAVLPDREGWLADLRLRAAPRLANVDSGEFALELSTDADLVETVMRFADLRKRKRNVRVHDVPVA